MYFPYKLIDTNNFNDGKLRVDSHTNQFFDVTKVFQ